jgi:hypothetical protein
MATTTFDGAVGTAGNTNSKSFARRLLDRYMDAQMKKATLRVNAYLQSLDDTALSQLGYTPADIRNIRRREASLGLMI